MITAEPIYYPKPGNSRLVARNIQVKHRCDHNDNRFPVEKKCETVLKPGDRVLSIDWTDAVGNVKKVTYHCADCALKHFGVRFLSDPNG